MTWRSALFVLLISPFLANSALAAEAKDCRLTRFSEIPVTTLSDGRFTVPITLEGHQLNFLVDTGGAIATIESSQAYNLQLKLKATSRALQGVGGTQLPLYATIEKTVLGGMAGEGLIVYLDPYMPEGADGTLAPDMMKHFDVDLDLARGRINLFSQKHCAGKVVYWTNTGYVVLPMTLASSGHIRVPVTIDGKKFRAVLDTGARDTIMKMDAAKELGISPASPDLKLLTEKGEAYSLYDYPFKQLDFDGITVNKPRIRVASDGFLPGKDADMIIGIGILRRLHLYIAYDEEKLYVTPATAN